MLNDKSKTYSKQLKIQFLIISIIISSIIMATVTMMATDTTASAVVDDLHSNVDAATTMVTFVSQTD